MFLAVAALASAQTMYDAINLSQNNYYGTARTIGMANAVTAVGADLGSVGINPAGSAVAGYSQFTITPGLVISSTTASYAPSFANYYTAPPANPLSETQQFGPSVHQSTTKFAMPNIGAMVRFNTGIAYGLRAITMGIVANASSYFNDDFTASGDNTTTSMSGAFAAFATANADGAGHKMPGNILTYSDVFDSRYNWNYISAYWGGMINYNRDADNYFGSAETVKRTEVSPGVYNYDYYVAGTLRQRYSSQTSGRKQDIVLNLGFDVNDCFFLGFNLGIPEVSHKTSQVFTETARDMADFPVTPEYISSNGQYVVGAPTTFDHSRYEYFYDSSTYGIYGKVGFICLPGDNLRIGGAIQTPTAFNVTETWQVGVKTYFGNNSSEYCDSATGEYKYRFRAPWSFNAGLAYTVGTFGMVSLDYEMTDFGSMKYKSTYGRNDDNFYRVNRLNSLFCGPSHALRLGVEVKPLPFVAVRAGYSFKSDPTYTYDSALGKVDSYAYDANFDRFESGYYSLDGPKKAGKDNISAFSFGLGYSSAGSFFSDFAVRRTSYPTTYTSPYSCYIDGDDLTVFSPEICSTRKLWDVVLTLGWRF